MILCGQYEAELVLVDWQECLALCIYIFLLYSKLCRDRIRFCVGVRNAWIFKRIAVFVFICDTGMQGISSSLRHFHFHNYFFFRISVSCKISRLLFYDIGKCFAYIFIMIFQGINSDEGDFAVCFVCCCTKQFACLIV